MAAELTASRDLALTRILERCGPKIVAATPLGLGKPNGLLNALYRHVVAHPELQLALFTALSLAVPTPKPGLEARFLQPFLDRHFGADYPQLEYLVDRRNNALPANVRVTEFYLQSGAWLGHAETQADYASINYTHVARDMAMHRPNLLLQLVARRGDRISLSCNPDTTLDLLDRMREDGIPKPFVVFVVHPDLPFLGNSAELPLDFPDLLLDEAGPAHRLFALPREPVIPAEHAIGLYASTWIKDGGTLQIGIGALSDAIVHASIWRHRHQDVYARQIADLDIHQSAGPERGTFVQGLYGASEMVMDGFMHLRKAGILKRLVYDDLGLQQLLNNGQLSELADLHTLDRLIEAEIIPTQLDRPALDWLKHFGWMDADVSLRDGRLTWPDGSESGALMLVDDDRRQVAAHMRGRHLHGGRYLHGGFWLGSAELQQWLRNLHDDDWRGLSMTRISHINQLYGGRESLEIAQRHHARFFNTTMMYTLLGAAVSDALDNGQVVSGVGGQYNFVAMAHAIPNGRSLLLLRATRESHGQVRSNIVWNYGHCTIPRHLRDIVITEYGCADLRGQADGEVIKRMLAITDARFQDELLATAKAAGKIERAFVIPERWRGNTPQALHDRLAGARSAGQLAAFPFGSDLNEQEIKLGKALKRLKAATGSTGGKIRTIARALIGGTPGQDHQPFLQRLQLQAPVSIGDRIMARLVCWALNQDQR